MGIVLNVNGAIILDLFTQYEKMKTYLCVTHLLHLKLRFAVFGDVSSCDSCHGIAQDW